uniref:Uncharacterized protein n=1 Tax=Rhizophora mucronata TaxID=61149 RepID=A0A2P2IK85_RHIMU
MDKECASPLGSIMKCWQQRRLAIRDFPEGCSLPMTFSAQMLKTQMKIEVPGSKYDYNPEEEVMIHNNARLVIELPTGSVKMVIYPPQRSISAVQLFLRGCGRKNPHFDKEGHLKLNEIDSDRIIPECWIYIVWEEWRCG